MLIDYSILCDVWCFHHESSHKIIIPLKLSLFLYSTVIYLHRQIFKLYWMTNIKPKDTWNVDVVLHIKKALQHLLCSTWTTGGKLKTIKLTNIAAKTTTHFITVSEKQYVWKKVNEQKVNITTWSCRSG